MESVSAVPVVSGSVSGSGSVSAGGGEEAASHAGDILADLSALQREVDALRGLKGGQ
jgi:hypothetical protein